MKHLQMGSESDGCLSVMVPCRFKGGKKVQIFSWNLNIQKDCKISQGWAVVGPARSRDGSGAASPDCWPWAKYPNGHQPRVCPDSPNAFEPLTHAYMMYKQNKIAANPKMAPNTMSGHFTTLHNVLDFSPEQQKLAHS